MFSEVLLCTLIICNIFTYFGVVSGRVWIHIPVRLLLEYRQLLNESYYLGHIYQWPLLVLNYTFRQNLTGRIFI